MTGIIWNAAFKLIWLWELGNLRDVRLVIPALNSKSFDARLSAVACLAFLQNEEGNKHLQTITVKDTDSAIRKVADWANAFIQELIKFDQLIQDFGFAE